MPIVAPDFDRFWAAYPKKVDKRAAFTAWRTATKRAQPSAIVAGAERYAADPGRSPQYTKNPATWLRADSWDNEPLPRNKPANKTNGVDWDAALQRAAERDRSQS